MREVGKALRRAVVELLDGNLTYEETNVPVFDGKEEGDNSLYVMIIVGNENTDEDTKSMSVSDLLLSFDIVNIRDSTLKSEVLEDVSDQIKQMIVPDKRSYGFELEEPLSLCCCDYESSGEPTTSDISGRFKYVKRINFRTIITQ